jgi:integrase
MQREKIVILPKLYDFGGSMNANHKWYVEYSVRNHATGKMVRKKVYQGLSKIKNKQQRYKEAELIIQDLTDKLKAGWNPLVDDSSAIYTDHLQYKFAARIYKDRKAGNRTVNFFINRYMKERMAGLDKNTVSTYTSKYRVFQMWADREGMKDNDITAFNTQVIQRFFSYLNNERESSHITYKKYKQLIYGLFDYISDIGLIPYNPVQKLPKCTRVVDKTPKPINDEDAIVFMQRIRQEKQLYLFLLFEYYCLMRPTEIRLMKIHWIDFGRKIIRIPKEISKTRKPKSPIIPIKLMEILRDEYKLHLLDRDWYVIGKQNGEPGDGHLGKNTMRARFNKIRKELDMPNDYMLYSWKHTANVRLLEQGIPGYDRMMQNGHSSIITTEKYTKNKAGFKSDVIENDYPKL